MTELIVRGDEIKYTILSYDLGSPIEEEVDSDEVEGYILKDKFVFIGAHEPDPHWSLDIIKNYPVSEWIVYECSPEDTLSAFGKVISKYYQTLHIYKYDIWSIAGMDSKVAVVTSWERY